jgi:hypothetical protein
MGMMSKWFALMDIRQVDFDGGQANSGNRIADCNARMGIGGWIDDDALFDWRMSMCNPKCSASVVRAESIFLSDWVP